MRIHLTLSAKELKAVYPELGIKPRHDFIVRGIEKGDLPLVEDWANGEWTEKRVENRTELLKSTLSDDFVSFGIAAEYKKEANGLAYLDIVNCEKCWNKKGCKKEFGWCLSLENVLVAPECRRKENVPGSGYGVASSLIFFSVILAPVLHELLLSRGISLRGFHLVHALSEIQSMVIKSFPWLDDCVGEDNARPVEIFDFLKEGFGINRKYLYEEVYR